MYAWGDFVDSDSNALTPTCVFLDYLLLHQKVKLGENQVVVLPESYHKQQAQLAAVLGRLVVPHLASYTNVFLGLDPQGNVTCKEVQL